MEVVGCFCGSYNKVSRYVMEIVDKVKVCGFIVCCDIM